MPPKEIPARHNLQFYQCSNPACALRFPAPISFKKTSGECPRCKSPVNIVPTRGEVQDFGQRTAGNDQRSRLEVLLDNIRSTFNVGAMLRSSDGAGIDHAYLCGITPKPDNPRITKVSLGAEFSVPWSYHPNSIEVVADCKNRGMQVCALEILPDAVSVFDTNAIGYIPTLLVVGNEVSGIDPGILELCDRTIYIPMLGYKRSLNVAVAFGIAVYTLEFGRRLDSANLDPTDQRALKL